MKVHETKYGYAVEYQEQLYHFGLEYEPKELADFVKRSSHHLLPAPMHTLDEVVEVHHVY